MVIHFSLSYRPLTLVQDRANILLLFISCASPASGRNIDCYRATEREKEEIQVRIATGGASVGIKFRTLGIAK